MIEFKIGDTVECVEESAAGFVGIVGKTYTVLDVSHGKHFVTTDDPYGEFRRASGQKSERYKLVERKKDITAFKPGDKVKKVDGTAFSNGMRTVTVYSVDSTDWCWLKETDTKMRVSKLELVKPIQYEDKWNLNDGSVEIPDDAEKLMNPEGTSVVAFRYVKKPVVETYTRYVEAGWSSTYTTTEGRYTDSIAKLTFITTDGELTDVKWERIS